MACQRLGGLRKSDTWRNTPGGPGEEQGQRVADSRIEWIHLMRVEVWVKDDGCIRGAEADTSAAGPSWLNDR